MSPELLVLQLLNGLSFGALLFLVASVVVVVWVFRTGYRLKN